MCLQDLLLCEKTDTYRVILLIITTGPVFSSFGFILSKNLFLLYPFPFK